MTQQITVGSSLSRIHDQHSYTPEWLGLLWTSDQPDAENSIWQHTTLTRDKYPCSRRDSNPQSQKASDRRPTARSLRSAIYFYLIFVVPCIVTLLKPTGYVMHHQFNIQQLYALPTLYLCVLYLSENKQRLVPLTA